MLLLRNQSSSGRRKMLRLRLMKMLSHAVLLFLVLSERQQFDRVWFCPHRLDSFCFASLASIYQAKTR